MFEGSLLGDPFCRFPITDTDIVQPRRYQQIGIVFLPNIVVGRIGGDVIEIFWVVRVALFFKFSDSERQGTIRHGVQHVDERDDSNNSGKQVRTHIHDRPHQ